MNNKKYLNYSLYYISLRLLTSKVLISVEVMNALLLLLTIQKLVANIVKYSTKRV